MSKININKINDFDAIRNVRQTDGQRADKSELGSTDKNIEVGEDKLQFSERATEVGKLIDQVKTLPDVREAKVNALKEQIANDNFNPSSETIADAFLKEEQ